MTDLRAARESYKSGVISNIVCIRSRYNLADGLPKLVRCAAMKDFWDGGVLKLHIEQWLITGAFARDIVTDQISESDRDEETGLHKLVSSRHLCESEIGEWEKKGGKECR